MTTRMRQVIQRDFNRLANCYARTRRQKSIHEARAFVDWIRPGHGEAILDAACGPGILARTMAHAASRAFALDISSNMVEFARADSSSNDQPFLAVGDVGNLPYATGSFDLVTCSYSFANFFEPLQVLREFARVTRFGGRIAIIDVIAPSNHSQNFNFNCLEALRSHCYTHALNRVEFLRLFEDARLKLSALRIRRCRQHFNEWVRLSPALTGRRSRKLRQALLKSFAGNETGSHVQRTAEGYFVSYTTAWFLLCKDVRPN